MFKKTAILFIFVFFFLAKPSSVFAQSFDFNKAYQDYIYTQGVYKIANTNFQNSRDAYLKNPTLLLKDDARKKAIIVLIARDDLEKVYLTALKIKIAEVGGIDTDRQKSIFGKIDSEVSWYKDHKDKYKESDLVEDLFNKNTESQARYTDNTIPTIYNALFDISLGQVVSFRTQQENIYKGVRDFIKNQEDLGKLSGDPFNRWFNDIEKNTNSLKDNENKSIDQINKIDSGQNYSPTGTFSTAAEMLSESKTLLSQFNSFLIELINSIQSSISK